MNLCSGSGRNSHDEVCYEGRTCPVCEVKEDLGGTIKDLQKQVADLEGQVADE